MKNKSIIVIIIMLICTCSLVCIVKTKQMQPIDCLKEYTATAAPIDKVDRVLYQDYVNDWYLIFYINERENLRCAILKKSILSYKVSKISGEVLLFDPNRQGDDFYSSFNNHRDWIAWGIVRNNKITQVLVNGKLANLINVNVYDYRIFYLLGKGMEKAFPNTEYK